jgi:hypothetical protein
MSFIYLQFIIETLVYAPVDEFMSTQKAANLLPDAGEQRFTVHGQSNLLHNGANKNSFDIAHNDNRA